MNGTELNNNINFMLKLEFPSVGHKEIYEKFKKEWGDVEKIPTSPEVLFKGDNYEEFLKWIEDDILGINWGVKGHLFFLVDDETNEILGGVQIRHTIDNPNLFENGGHIGYGIAPKFRRKGYATKMLELALLKVKELGLDLDKVLITCDIDNIGSSKVVEKNGGVFERITEIGKKRYWVDVK